MAPVSVGDCIAITEVLIKAAKALRDSDGAAAEYREVDAHGTALKVALEHLRQLEQGSSLTTPNELGGLLKLCEGSLGNLHRKKAKYESTLGGNSRKNPIQSSLRKMQWALVSSKDVKDLRAVLSAEMISVVLALQSQLLEGTTGHVQQGIKIHKLVTDSMTQQTDNHDASRRDMESLKSAVEGEIHTKIHDLTEDISALSLSSTRDHERTQALVVPLSDMPTIINRSLTTATANLDSTLKAEMQKLVQSFRQDLMQLKNEEPQRKVPASCHDGNQRKKCSDQVVATESRATQVLPLLTSLSRQSIQFLGVFMSLLIDALSCLWIYLRILGPSFVNTLARLRGPTMLYHRPVMAVYDSVRFFDALGRMHPLPFIFFQDYEVLRKSLRVAFRNLPGEDRVKRGAYVLHNMQTRQSLHRENWQHAVVPGSQIGMSMMITEFEVQMGYCPRPTCRKAFEFVTAQQEDFFICPECQLSFIVSEATAFSGSQGAGVGATEATNKSRSEDLSVFQRIHLLHASTEGPGSDEVDYEEPNPDGSLSLEENWSWDYFSKDAIGGDMWICSQCYSPNLIAIAPACPICGHLPDQYDQIV